MTTALPVYLERIDASRRMARFYAIRVERTLFGDWAVIYRWGRIGARGRRQEECMATRKDATRAAARKLRGKEQRGYVLKDEGRGLAIGSLLSTEERAETTPVLAMYI